MDSKKLWVLGLFVLAVLGAFLFLRGYEGDPTPEGFDLLDNMEVNGAPNITLKSIDGTEFDMSKLSGKIVIVNFWASNCAPCLEEFPSMIKLVEEMKGEVQIVAVSGDDSESEMKTFASALSLPKPNLYVVWDPNKAALKAYGVEKLPESFILDRKRKLVRKVMGSEDWGSKFAIEFFRSAMAAEEKSSGVQ